MSCIKTACEFIEDCQTMQDRIVRYDALINGLLDAGDKAVLRQHIDEYWIDDGQTKVKTIYRSAKDIAQAILDIERLRQICINRVNGRMLILKDRNSNIRRNRHGFIR